MRLSNTPDETTVLRLEQRKSFSCLLQFVDGGGGRIDLTQSTITLDWVTNLAKLDRLEELAVGDVRSVAAVLVDPAYGIARLDVQAADLALAAGAYPFTITLRTAGYSVVVVKGQLQVQANPELSAAGQVFQAGAPNQSLIVQLAGSGVVRVEVASVLPPRSQYLSDEDKAKLDLLVVTGGGVEVDLTDYVSTTDLEGAVDAINGELAETQGELTDAVIRLGAQEARAAAGFTTLTGEMKMWPTEVAPTGWLLCRGQILNKADHPALAALLGNTYAGDAQLTSAQFRLPHFGARLPMGADPLTHALGASGGEATHTLTAEEMPSHTHVQNAHSHSVTDPGHRHLNPVAVVDGGNANQYRALFATNSPFWSLGDTNNPTAASVTGLTLVASTAVNQSTGGGAAHNNLPPYLTVNFIIKT